jgi:hypothetical protein
MDLTGPRPFTATGIELLAVDPEFPFPSCPEELYPQHIAELLSSIAQLWFSPALMDFTG